MGGKSSKRRRSDDVQSERSLGIDIRDCAVNITRSEIYMHRVIRAIYADSNELNRYIAFGGDLNAESQAGDTLLKNAIDRYCDESTYVEVVLQLIYAGADVNHQSMTKYTSALTPLMYYIIMQAYIKGRKRPKVITILIEAGADINRRGYYGETALMIACKLGC